MARANIGRSFGDLVSVEGAAMWKAESAEIRIRMQALGHE
jgi:hypothetical protein